MNSEPITHPKVVFFDGVCGFCNRSVDFLIRIDKRRILKFSPIQGEYAKHALPESCRENVDTIVYCDDDELYVRTTALLRILRDVGGFWTVFYALIVVPESWRDWAYRLFSKNRYKLFGKREACRIPSPEEREQFLD